MYSQFNSNFATTIEEAFKYNKDTHAVSMNCYRTENGERVERYMTLSYNESTKKYTLTIVPYKEQARSVFTTKKRSDIGYINLKRTFYAGIYGTSHTNRSNCLYVGNTMASYLLQSRSLECDTEPAD